MTHTKESLLTALRQFVCSRPGLEPAAYDDASHYRAESRRITSMRDDALALIYYVEQRESITAEDILAAAKRTRLQITDAGIDPCTGQLYPAVDRAAVCRLMSEVIWHWARG